MLLYNLNFIIAISGIYSLPKLLRFSVANCKRNNSSLTTKELSEFYWATVIVVTIINVSCSGIQIHYVYKTEPFLFNNIILPLIVIIFLIEAIAIPIVINDFKISNTICCCSNRHLLRAIHTFAICNILWFLHRVGSNLFMSIFFIAIVPAQTLAAISLIYFIIFFTIIYVTYNYHSIKTIKRSNCAKVICKLLLVSFFFLLIVTFLVFLTLLFVELANNGLTSSGLGSLILSLVAPTIVFIITLKLKHHLGKFFKGGVIIDHEDSMQETKLMPLINS